MPERGSTASRRIILRRIGSCFLHRLVSLPTIILPLFTHLTAAIDDLLRLHAPARVPAVCCCTRFHLSRTRLHDDVLPYTGLRLDKDSV